MFSINSCYHFYLVLCSSAALKQLRNIYLFSVHTGGSWINFYSSITADLHKLAKVEHTVFSNIFPEAGILKVFFRGTFKLGVQHYVHSRSLTLRLARVKYWGHSTQLFAYDELTKLTGEFSDLSLYPNWISLRDVLPEAAGRAEASPHWWKSALTGLVQFLLWINQWVVS